MPSKCQIGFYHSESHDIPISLFCIHDKADPETVIPILKELLFRYQQEQSRWNASEFAPWVVHEFIKIAIENMKQAHTDTKGKFFRKDGYDFLHFSIEDWIQDNLNHFYRLDNPYTIKIMGGRNYRRIETEIPTREE